MKFMLSIPRISYQRPVLVLTMICTVCSALFSIQSRAANTDNKGNYCGLEGNWIQILGSGGAELDDRRAGVSYIVWIDGKAKLLVDAGPGTAVRFDEAGAKI